MREIKFRAWHKKEKWMDGVWAWDIEHGMLCFTSHSQTSMKDCILMQFTGLLDKNGKEIYEGDIFKLVIGTYIVEWDGSGLYHCKSLKYPNCCGFTLSEPNCRGCEIIGNRFENPELLKV